MTFQPVPDTAEFKVVFTADKEQSFGLYARDEVNPWIGASLLAICNQLAVWYTSFLGVFAPQCELTRVDGRDLVNEFGDQATFAVGAPGTASGDIMPANVSALTTWHGDPGGPPRQGHANIPCTPEDAWTAGVLSAGYITSYESMQNGVAAQINAAIATAAQVIVTRFQGFTLVPGPGGTTRKKPTPRAPALTNTLASPSCTVRGIAGSQRSRRLR